MTRIEQAPPKTTTGSGSAIVLNVGLFIVADGAPERRWLYRRGVPQITHRHVAAWGPVNWHAQEPSDLSADPDRAHRDYLGQTQATRLRRRTKRAAKAVSALRSRKVDTFGQFQRIVTDGESLRQLLADARAGGFSHLACVMDSHVGVSPAAIDLALKFTHERKADLVRCTQLDGLLPAVVSVDLLERWLRSDEDTDLRRLWRSGSLLSLGTVLDLQLADPRRFPGQVRCWPLDERETAVTRFWSDRADELSSAMLADPTTPGRGRQSVEAILAEYCSRLVAGLETYEVVGSMAGVDDVRRGMVTTEKPVVDYFVVATHLARFLQRFAGLRPNTYVVDIGCSWGYFGFVLANFLSPDGGYIGIEVQRSAVDWARQRLSWLGKNFRFEHLDIYNAFYNPAGTIPRDNVHLPISAGSADLILAGSVFTHMTEDGVQSYLREFRRILRPGGVAAFSYDDTSFFGGEQESTVVNKSVPDKTTFYSRERIREMVEKAGLMTRRAPVNFRLFGRTDFQTWYFASIPDTNI